MESTITVVGNLVADPVRRSTTDGIAVTDCRIASTPRRYDKAVGEWRDGQSLFINVSCWRALADNVSLSLHRGDSVIVTGRLSMHAWTDKEDRPRNDYEIEALAIGPDLNRAVCRVDRRARTQSEGYTAPPADWPAPLTGQGGADEAAVDDGVRIADADEVEAVG